MRGRANGNSPAAPAAKLGLVEAQKAVNEAEQGRRNAAVVRRGAIRYAREIGMTWDEIAAVLGITRPSAITAGLGYEASSS